MSNIFDIPQIPASPIENLQNDLHIGFGGDVAKRIQKVRWTDETRSTKVFPENVDALMGAFVMAQATEDEVYVKAQGSDLTKQRLEKDAQKRTCAKALVMTHAYSNAIIDKVEEALKNGIVGNEDDDW